MQIFLLDLEEYAPHVILLLLSVIFAILAYLRHIFLTLSPCVSVRLAYLRHLHPLRRSRHQRPRPLQTRKTSFL